MPTEADILPSAPLTAERCSRLARWGGVAAAVIGLGVIVGWLLDFRPLMTLLPGLVAMKPNTAFALCFGGLSLAFFARPADDPSHWRRSAATALAALTAGVGALTLAEYLSGVNLGIDELLFKDFAVSSVPGRMAPISAFNLVCLGLALLLLRFPKAANWSHALAGAAACTSLLSVVGLLYGGTALYQSGRFTAVALHSAIAFLLLGAGVCGATSQRGFMRVATSPGTSGSLLRRFGITAIFIPFLIGWGRSAAVHAGWCGADLAAVVVAVANAATLAALGWISASSLWKAEREQMRTQEGLRESEERLHLVVEQLTEGLVIANLEGRMLHWNRAALEMHGFATLDEGLRWMPEFERIFELSDSDGRILPFDEWPMPRVSRGEMLQNYEVRIRRPEQGWTRIFNYSGSMVRGANGRSLAFVTTTDITRQKAAEAQAEAAIDKFHQTHLELEVRVLQRTSELAQANADLKEQMLERSKVEHANQQIMDHSLDVICTFDAKGRFLQVSRACESLWGHRPEELVGRSYLEVVHPEDRERTTAIAASVRRGQPAREFENRYLHKDGSVVPLLWSAQWSREHRVMFCVGRDMTARKQVELAQSRAREAAEASNRAKSEFLANMSHEIRTPMNGILGMVDLVLDTRLDRPQREYLGMAKTSADTLLGLINDILDFSKIEAGKLELESIDFNLRDCVGAMLKPLGIRADQKGLELTADIAEDVPRHVVGDPTRLRQILINLTDNAIKFTRRGDVTLRVAVEGESDGAHRLRFTVSDTGIGIPAEKQALIFEAFAQADGTTTRTYGGTGLGLAIASRLVEQMQGRIWVESTPGQGTAFHFTARLANGREPEAVPVRPRRLEGLSVLVVDDNAVNRRILNGMLTNWRMKPVAVASGREALAEMRRAAGAGAPYPLVILDGMMPEMDGFMVAEAIRGNTEISGATVMMLSSAMPTDAASRCAELGLNSYLTKPVGQSDLIEAILLAIGGQEAEGAPFTDAAPPAAAGSGLRILLAEDNLINCALATGLLEKRGHTLVHAANGREAVEAARRERFDLILMDVQMPEMDGLEATRRIREAESAAGRHTPIAAMTAHAMTGDRERFLASGMDEYVSKPLQRAELFALLARIAEERESVAALPVVAPVPGGVAATLRDLPASKPPARVLEVFSREEFLAQLDGDEELMQQMIALFQENTPRLLDDIGDAIARRSPGDVARSTHALLSSLGVVGAAAARRLTLEVAAHGERGDYGAAGADFAALAGEIAEIKTFLSDFHAMPA